MCSLTFFCAYHVDPELQAPKLKVSQPASQSSVFLLHAGCRVFLHTCTHVTAITQTNVVSEGMASRFLHVARSTCDGLLTNQAVQVFVLRIVTSKTVKGLEDSLPLCHAYFVTTVPQARTSKAGRTRNGHNQRNPPWRSWRP